MSEVWDLIDHNKRRTGYVINREDCDKITHGLYHLTVRIWIKDNEGKILLTQRHENRDEGLLWENTGGSVIAHETGPQGAVRELYEETANIVENIFIRVTNQVNIATLVNNNSTSILMRLYA